MDERRDRESSKAWPWQAAVLVGLFVAVYGLDCGRGFISDDYAWILHGRVQGVRDLSRIFTSAVGFYRPLVSLSFGLNHSLFGLNAPGYGFTNLALALACGLAIVMLARALRLPRPAAVTAAALWLFNFHGINMGILWLSGRTSLLLTLFGLLAATAFLRGRTAVAAAATAAALLSKEEATLLPLLFTVWALVLRRAAARWPDVRLPAPSLASTVPLWAVCLLYLGGRARAGAMWPTTAPDYYRPALDAFALMRNVTEYTDRSLSFSVAAVLLTWIGVRRFGGLTGHDRTVIRLGITWLMCGFALTVFAPIRSSLYAVFPSAGAAVAAAACIDALTRSQPSSLRRRLSWAAIGVLTLLIPVYWSRNVRWTELADLSASVVAQMRSREAHVPPGSTIAIEDDESTRANLRNAWGGLTPEMSQLTFEGRVHVVVRGAGQPLADHPGAIPVRLERGRLVGLP